MRLVVFHNGTQTSEVVCQEEAVYIGSGEGCGLHLPDERVADQHAVIYPESDQDWVIEPLAEPSHLMLNGQALAERRRLCQGDRITLFDYEIEVHAAAVRSEHAPPGRTTVQRMTQFVKYQLPPGAVVRKPEDMVSVDRDHLSRAARAAVHLAPCETHEQFIDVVLRTMLEMFNADRAWLGLRRVNYGPMEYVEGRLLTGKPTELTETGEHLKPRVLDRGQFVLIPRISRQERVSVLAGPLLGADGTIGMAYLDSGDRGRLFTIEDLDRFNLLLAVAAAHLDAIFKHMAQQRAAILEGEVAVAHAIQARLTPRKLPQWEQLQFGAFREPGRERTSDIYDVVRLSNRMAAFVIARTHASGALPSMHMAQIQAAFRSAMMHQDLPHIFLRSLNVLLYDGTEEVAVDCFMGAIDPESGRMRYAAAGGIGAYIIDARGQERRLVPEPVPPALGMQRDTQYETRPDVLEHGETLVLYTPGVVTARNREGEVFGEERFLNILCDGFGQLASQTLKEMLNDLQNFTQGGSQPEDITVILTHRV